MAKETVLSRGERKAAAWALAIGMLLCAVGLTAREGLAHPSIPDRGDFASSAPEARPLGGF